MKIKTVSTVLTTDTAGKVVESIPIKYVDGKGQNSIGQWVDPALVEEDARGVPVRVITTDTTLNSIGKVVGATLTTGVGVPAGFSLWKTDNQVWRFGTQRAISPART